MTTFSFVTSPRRRNAWRGVHAEKEFCGDAWKSRRRGGLSRRSSRQRGQRRHDFRAPGFEPGRQLDRATECLLRLVQGEAGVVGGDLEQHAAGLFEIDRAEIAAIALVGRLQSL